MLNYYIGIIYMSSFKKVLTSHDPKKIDLTVENLTVSKINGNSPPVFPSANDNTIALFTGLSDPILKSSDININNNDINNVKSINAESTQDLDIITDQNNGVSIKNGNNSKVVEFRNENNICDNYLQISGTDSTSIQGFGPIISCHGQSIGIIEQVNNNGAHVLLDNNQSTTPALIYVCGGIFGFNGTVSLSANGNVTNDNTVYCLPNVCGNNNDVLTLSGPNPSGISLMTWQPIPTPTQIYQDIHNLPIVGFNNPGSFYQKWPDNAVNLWYQTSSLNGAYRAGILNEDMGKQTVYLRSGVWRLTCTTWPSFANGGIVDVTLDSVSHTVDTSLGTQITTTSWDQSILTNNYYDIGIKNVGTNASGYDIYFGADFITLVRISDLP